MHKQGNSNVGWGDKSNWNKIFEVMKGNTHKPKVKINEKSCGKPQNKKGINTGPSKLICFANSIHL